MKGIAKAVRRADKILNLFISMIIILALLYGCYALWDTYRIYKDAGIDSGLLKYKPSGDASGQTLSELMALNEDVRAWLIVDYTGIDYPVVQGVTNMDYINTDVYGNFAISGSIFMDCRNAPDFSDFYTLLHGHHMEGGVMFGDLTKFHEKAYFAWHTTGKLYTEAKTFQLEIFACLAVDAYDKNIFSLKLQGKDLLEYIQENSLHYREIKMNAEDQIIGLSTCSDAATNGRTVVFARMYSSQLPADL